MRLKFYGPKREDRFVRFSQKISQKFSLKIAIFETFLTSFPVFDPEAQFFGYGWPGGVQRVLGSGFMKF